MKTARRGFFAVAAVVIGNLRLSEVRHREPGTDPVVGEHRTILADEERAELAEAAEPRGAAMSRSIETKIWPGSIPAAIDRRATASIIGSGPQQIRLVSDGTISSRSMSCGTKPTGPCQPGAA